MDSGVMDMLILIAVIASFVLITVIVKVAFQTARIKRQGGPSKAPYFYDGPGPMNIRTKRVRKSILNLPFGLVLLACCVFFFAMALKDGSSGDTKNTVGVLVGCLLFLFGGLYFVGSSLLHYVHDRPDRIEYRNAYGRLTTIMHSDIARVEFIEGTEDSDNHTKSPDYWRIIPQQGRSIKLRDNVYWAPHLFHALAVKAATELAPQDASERIARYARAFNIELFTIPMDDYMHFLESPDAHYVLPMRSSNETYIAPFKKDDKR
ncbi:MAG: hypothetical protein Q4P66_06700 [Actinomycetaceae bacterium]|nr:hypothetical protein [Actinomycetaceae bacterium]